MEGREGEKRHKGSHNRVGLRSGDIKRGKGRGGGVDGGAARRRGGEGMKFFLKKGETVSERAESRRTRTDVERCSPLLGSSLHAAFNTFPMPPTPTPFNVTHV